MGTPKAPAGDITIPSFRQRVCFQQLKAFTKASPRIHPVSLAAHEVLMQDARQQGGFMKVMILNFVKFAACMVLVVGLSASASASCGDSLSAMAALAASVHSQSRPTQQNSQSAGDNSGKSMVGLWHTQFTVGDQALQDAYQIWNVGGTEVHNANVDPRGGFVCLGAWKRAPHGVFKLVHRALQYDTNGAFLGTIHLSETLTLGNGGNTHSGSFTIDFYDPSGTFQFEVTGNVTGERISVE
jgi:hypothetical protein